MTLPTAPDDRTEPNARARPEAAATLGSAVQTACGAAALDFLAPPAAPGQLGLLGPYQILEVLSAGPCGAVLKGFEPRLQRFVTIKVLAARATDPATRAAFLGQARAAAAVSHENLATIHAVAEEPFPHLVMEYVPGQSLQSRLDSAGPLPLLESVLIARQVAAALAALHRLGLVHKGVNPGNILLVSPGGHVKLTHLGLELDSVGEPSASLPWLSPEQAQGQPADAGADLYGLGAVLYALCTGRPPFRTGEGEPQPIGEINPDVPAWLVGLLARLMARAPSGRPGSAAEVVDLLDRHLHRLQVDRETISEAPPPVRRQRAGWVALATALLLVAGLALAEAAGWTSLIAPEPRRERHLSVTVKPDREPDTPHAASASAPSYNKWASLFNSKDLAGWKRKPGDLGDWRVEAGLLTGSGPTSYLVSERGDYRDFHLRAEARLNAGGNSGLCFRCPASSRWEFLAKRYEADIYNGPPDQPWMTGALWGTRSVPLFDTLVSSGAWYTHEVIARGKHIVVKVNGRTTVDLLDEESQALDGHFALQAEWAKTVVQFRKIEVMELPSPRPARSLDELKREHILEEELLVAGNGDPANAPKELVAVFGSNRLKSWGNNLAIVFSPDNKLLATAGSDTVVRLHDALCGRQVGILVGHTGTIRGLAFLDNKRLASASEDGTVKIWDVPGRKELLTIKHPGPVLAVAWSSGGRLATASGTTITLRDPKSGKETDTITHDELVFCLAFSPDGKRLAAGGDVDRTRTRTDTFGELRVWDVETGKMVTMIGEHAGPVWSVAFSPDGKRLASGAGYADAEMKPDDGREVKVFDTTSWAEVRTIACPTYPVRCVSFSPDSKQIVSVQNDGARVWDAATGEKAIDLEGYNFALSVAAFSPDGKRLASGFLQYVLVRHASTGKVLISHQDAGGGFNVAFSPDGTKLGAGTWGAPTIRDTRTGERLPLKDGHLTTGPAIAFSADGRFLATGSNENTVKVHETATGKNLLTLAGHTAAVITVAFSPDGRKLASGGGDRKVKVWELPSGKELHSFSEHLTSVRRLVFSPDSRRLASVGGWHAVRLWDLDTGKLLHKLGMGETAHGVAFTADGKRILSGARLRLWDAESGKLLRPLEGHPDSVHSVVLSPDGKSFATCGSMGHVLVWDASTLTIRHRWKLPWEVSDVAFSPEGRHLATLNANATIYLLRLPPAPDASAKRGLNKGMPEGSP
jgi:WD40 repeat protein/serine/threonine protein kinase